MAPLNLKLVPFGTAPDYFLSFSLLTSPLIYFIILNPDWTFEKFMLSLEYQALQIWRLSMKLTAIIEREGDGYVSLCPELDIASQGDSVEQARNNLREALELFFETASSEEKKQRLHEEVFVTQLEVSFG